MRQDAITKGAKQTETFDLGTISKVCLLNGWKVTKINNKATLQKAGHKRKEHNMATMTLKATQTGTVKAQLEDLLISISWSDLAKRYFGKSGSWLYHKLDGLDGNKKPTDFSEEEKYQLKGALADLSDRIRRAADNIQ